MSAGLQPRRKGKSGPPLTHKALTLRAIQAEARPIRSDTLWHSLTFPAYERDGEHLWPRTEHEDIVAALVTARQILRLAGGLLIAAEKATPWQVEESRALGRRA